MANTKITELPAATAPAGDEILPVVQDAATKRTTLAELPVSDATATALGLKQDAATAATDTELAVVADALIAHVNDATDAHAASAIGFAPNGSIAATTVQAAIQEVRDEAGGATPDASTTVKGLTKLATAPVAAGNPIAVGDNDPRATPDQAAGVASVRTLGGSATQAAAGNHAHAALAVAFTPTGTIEATDVQAAISELLAESIALTQKAAANGVASLDGGGKVPTAQLPALAITSVFVVASQAAQLALTAEEGDVAVRSDQNKSYIHNAGSAGTMADWSELLAPTDLVLSVAGKTGAVSLVKGDVGLGSVDNTADAAKPVSTAQQTALDLKAPLVSPTFTGAPAAPTVASSDASAKLATMAALAARRQSSGTTANLGATYGPDFGSASIELWKGGTLNANLVVTSVTPVAGSKLWLSMIQDAATARTLTIDGTSVPEVATAPLGSLVLVLVRWLDASTFRVEVSAGGPSQLLPLSRTGALTVAAGTSRFRFPFAAVIESVATTVNTAPTGASLICDLNKNGTTMFTTQGNRPTIAASGFASSDAVPDVTAVAAGDYLTVDVDQIGSTIAGSDLVATVRFRAA